MKTTTKGEILNLGEVAALYGVHRNTISAWVRRGMPYLEKANRSAGREWAFDSAMVMEWREDQAAINAIGDVSSLDIDEARRRKLAAEAALAELDLSRVRGDSISISEVGAVWLDIVSASRSRMLSIPQKLAMLVASESDPMKIRSILEAEIEEALDELSRFEQG